MAFDESDIEQFIELLQRDPQLRDRVRNAIIADDFLALPGLVRQLGERMDQLTVRIEQLGERMDRVEATLGELVAAQLSAERRLNNLDGRVGNLEGWRFEHTSVDNLGSRLGAFFLRTRRVQLNEIPEMNQARDAGTITAAQWGEVAKLDFVAYALERGGGGDELLLAAELSVVIDETDVRRARARADVIKSAGLSVIPVVDGEVILPDAATLADELGVRYWLQPRTAA